MNPNFKLPKALLACAVFLFIVTSVFATNIYVKTTGSNTADGLSVTKAKKDVSGALLIANAGDTIFVAPGTYNEMIKPVKSGTVSNPITIIADTASKIFTLVTAGEVIITGMDTANYGLNIIDNSFINHRSIYI